jgi:hypothetical protein
VRRQRSWGSLLEQALQAAATRTPRARGKTKPERSS